MNLQSFRNSIQPQNMLSFFKKFQPQYAYNRYAYKEKKVQFLIFYKLNLKYVYMGYIFCLFNLQAAKSVTFSTNIKQ